MMPVIAGFLKRYWQQVLLVCLLLFSVILGTVALEYKNQLHVQRVINNAANVKLQAFDAKLGIAEATLLIQKDLAKKYKNDIGVFIAELQTKDADLRKKDLEILSHNKTIVNLKNKVKGGQTSTTTTTIVNEKEVELIVDIREVCSQTIRYTWSDKDNRFHLVDPDISISGNEEFTYSQYLKIKGLVLTDKSGNLQVKKVTVTELIPKISSDGEIEYEELEDSNVKLVESSFEYTNLALNEKKFKLTDPITLRPMAFMDSSLMPGIGLELVNIGRALPYANIGIVPKFAFDSSDILGGSLQGSRVGVGLMYHIGPPFIKTNFAIGVSLMTPINNLGTPILTFDLGFYLTEDLFFKE